MSYSDSFRIKAQSKDGRVEIRTVPLMERHCKKCGELLILEDRPRELVYCTECSEALGVKH